MAFEHNQILEWERTRNIELSSYASQVTMNGKKAFKLKKPSDLYELPTDIQRKQIAVKPIDKDRQLRAVNKHKKWLKTI